MKSNPNINNPDVSNINTDEEISENPNLIKNKEKQLVHKKQKIQNKNDRKKKIQTKLKKKKTF